MRRAVGAAAARFSERTGRAPGLEVVLVGDDPASHLYVRNKERAAVECGIRGHVHRLAATSTQDEVRTLVARLGERDDVDGILVQLPLPSGIDARAVLDAIDPERDVDGLHPVNAGRLASGRPGLRPCTPAGCMRLLDAVGFDVRGRHALVVGRSALVGKPVALMLLERDATVTIAHSRSTDLESLCKRADVLVVAVGRPGLVRGSWIRPGAVVLDVGTTRGADGKLRGDVDPSAAEHAAWMTPVPGGVGPMTVAMLLANTIEAAYRRAGLEPPTC